MTTPDQTELLASIAERSEIEIPMSLLEDLGRPALATDLRELADEGLIEFESDVVRITSAGRDSLGPKNSA